MVATTTKFYPEERKCVQESRFLDKPPPSTEFVMGLLNQVKTRTPNKIITRLSMTEQAREKGYEHQKVS
jgi:hypothetical protein